MINPIIPVKAKLCTNCGKETLNLYDSRLKTVPYDTYVMYKEQGIDVDLENRDLSHFKCSNCGAIYPVDRRGKFPYPVADYDIRIQAFEEKDHKKILTRND